jgi:hypothetical protein
VRRAGVLEWTAIVVASLAVSFGAIALLSGFFAGQDPAGVGGASGVPGATFKDLGAAHLQPGQPHPRYDSNPPTSGPHEVVPISGDGQVLNNDQLLQALEVGDVVLMYGTPSPPRGLQPLVSKVAYTFTPALAAAGQAVVLARRPGAQGIFGLAWAHMVQVGSPDEPLLRAFIQYWLGRGAPGK